MNKPYAMQTNRITEWHKPSMMLDSHYGDVTYQEWCEKEAKRIGKCYIEQKDGLIAVFKR